LKKKYSRIREPSVLVHFENFQNQTATSSGYFKNIKEPVGFVNEPPKNRLFFERFFDIFSFFESCGYILMPVIWNILRISVVIQRTAPNVERDLDGYQGGS